MEIRDTGIIISSKRFDLHKYTIDVLSKIGRWRGIASGKNSNRILCSEGFFIWKGRSVQSFGNILFEVTNSSKIILFWNHPKVISAIAAICESATKFTPERSKCPEDYNLFYSCIEEINSTNYIEKLFKWDRYLLQEYFCIPFKEFPPNREGLSKHCRFTYEISTRARDDLLKMCSEEV